MGNRHSVSHLSEQLDFIPEDNRVDNLKHHFNSIKVLGSGVTARVRAVTWTENQEKVALKQMNRKDKNNEKLFTRECRILQKLIHPNIVRYINCYIDRKYYYILTQLYTGGHLLKRIKKMEHFDEVTAAAVMKQIVEAVKYMHAHGIAHRDLKPENIVFEEDNSSRLVIIDLGSATELEEGEMYTEWVGSPAFMAPETLRARTSDEVKASDVWSIGVICYQLLTGKYPFWGHNLQQIFREIAQKPLSFPAMGLSEQALAFMKSMLHRGLHHRVSIEFASRDPWLNAVGRQFSRPLSHWSETDEHETETKSKEMEIEFKKQASTGQISSSLEELIESLEESEVKYTEDDDNSSDRGLYPIVQSPPPPTYRQKSSVPFIMALTGAGMTVPLEDIKEDDEFEDADVAKYAVEPFLQKRQSQWPEELGEDEVLLQAFEALDEERNGQVLLKDLQLAMEDFLHRRIAFEEAEVFLDEISPTQDGSIQFEDFARGMKALAEKSIIEITSLSIEASMSS